MKLFNSFILYLTVFISQTVSAQTLLKDIAPGNGNSIDIATNITAYSRILEVNNKLYFEAQESTVGELWVTDLATNISTKVLSNQNASLIKLSNFKSLNGQLIFLSGNDLYRSDGTTNGTYKLNKSFPLGTMLISVVYNDVLYFVHNDSINGEELWATDGTVNGTYLVKDINSGSSGSSPSGFFIFNGTLFFSAYTVGEGRELWKTDGTTANTVLVKDIIAGTSDSNPNSFIIFNNNLYFTALVGGYRTLIKTDGTTQGTIIGNITATNLKIYNNMLVFQRGGELWKSDGVNHIKFYTSQYVGTIRRFMVHNNRIYFIMYYDTSYYTTIPSYRVGLFTSDATTAGTVDIKTLSTASEILTRADIADNGQFADLAGTSYFLFSDPFVGDNLWRTDGTTQGTKLLKNLNQFVNGYILKDLSVLNNKLFYSCRDSSDKVDNILISDGTVSGTTYLTANNSLKKISIPAIVLNTNNAIIFRAYHPTYGFELWKTRGEMNDAVLLTDINRGTPESSNPKGSFFINNKMIFRANDIEHGEELWITDGTEQGTRLYFDCTPKFSKSLNSPDNDSRIGIGTIFSCFKVFKNALYFISNYRELWKADGINAPVKLKNFSSSSYSGNCKMVEMGGNLYFVWDYYLWKCDGQNVTSISYVGYSDGNKIIVFNNKLYFYNWYPGGAIWESDGTPSGTRTIQSLSPNTLISDFVISQGNLYVAFNNLFLKINTTSPYVTFVSDMGYSSDVLIYDYETSLYERRTLFSVNNKILFWGGGTSTMPTGLWRSNGTASGTVLASSMPPNIFQDVLISGNYLYYNFQGQTINRTNGTEDIGTTKLWNGKYMIKGPEGTLYSQRLDDNLVTQLYRNESNGTFTQLTNLTLNDNSQSHFLSIWGGRLYHASNTSTYGRELHFVNLPCQSSLSLTDPNENILEGVNSSYKTSGTITAVNKIDKNTIVNYTSESMIDLKPGFDVKNESVFTVETKGCNN